MNVGAHVEGNDEKHQEMEEYKNGEADGRQLNMTHSGKQPG